MKIILEIEGGCLRSVTATENCEMHIIDHDELKVGGDIYAMVADIYRPDQVTYELMVKTPLFDSLLKDIQDEYIERSNNDNI